MLKEMNRREFLRGVAVGGTALYASGMVGNPTKGWAAERTDIGECKSVKIRCISETSWFDNAQIMKDIQSAGGLQQINTPSHGIKRILADTVHWWKWKP